jgi:two-component system response regulator
MKAVTILLVEDNPTDLLLAREAINSCQNNISLHAVQNGQQALDFLEKKGVYRTVETPSIVLLDLMQPGTGSMDLLCTIRKNLKLRYIPVIVMSSQSDWQEARRYYASGANSYLPKPHDYNEFAKIIQGMEMFWLEACVLPAQNYFAVEAA